MLYGSDAIGGVVNAITSGPIYLERTPPAPVSGKSAKGAAPVVPDSGPYVTGGSSVRYASAEDSWTGRVEGSVSETERYGLHVGVTGSTFGDLRAADVGRLPKTGYDEYGMDAKLEWFLDEDTKFTLAHNQFHQDGVWRTHRTIYAVPFAGSAIGNEKEHYFDQDRYLTYLRLEGDTDGAVIFRMAAYDKLEQSMPGLTRKVLLPGIGHWIAEEAPAAVNDLLVEFLARLRTAS